MSRILYGQTGKQLGSLLGDVVQKTSASTIGGGRGGGWEKSRVSFLSIPPSQEILREITVHHLCVLAAHKLLHFINNQEAS